MYPQGCGHHTLDQVSSLLNWTLKCFTQHLVLVAVSNTEEMYKMTFGGINTVERLSGNGFPYCCYPQMEVDEAEEEDEEEQIHFSGQDLMKIRDAVVLLVQSLLRLLQTFPLKDKPQIAGNCTQVTKDSIVTPASCHTAAS